MVDMIKSTSYIDYDEIDSLISGIDYISKVNNSSTSFSSFQADYSTKGGLRVSTFSMNNEIKVAISSGRINKVKAYFNILFLPDIRELIGQAKNKIDALKVNKQINKWGQIEPPPV
ncbi:hypothetical protein [Candidatus Reidiella endopervernicosa]|nr:hypothetical protein [Candidatus Reidiella endopervernicosa]